MTHELTLALTLSVGLHAAAFVTVPGIEPVAFDIDRGPSSVEVYLVKPTRPVVAVQPQPQELPPPEPELPPEPQSPLPDVPEPVPQRVIAPEQKGAITEMPPRYLRNPPPVYPQAARQRGDEGTVVLEAHVSSSGRCEEIRVIESSGDDMLDEAALRAVQQWIFKPARRRQEPIAFLVEIPITFRLVEREPWIVR